MTTESQKEFEEWWHSDAVIINNDYTEDTPFYGARIAWQHQQAKIDELAISEQVLSHNVTNLHEQNLQLQAEVEVLSIDSARLKYLHTVNSDDNGWQWGVAHVRFDNHGQVASFHWGLSDSSDIDSCIISSISTQPTTTIAEHDDNDVYNPFINEGK